MVNGSDVLFICVPTPMDEPDETGFGKCNTSIVEEVIYEACDVATERKVFVIKSTVAPGTTSMIARELDNQHGVRFNPEFLTEKNYLSDFMNQKNTIIGVPTECDRMQPSCNLEDTQKLIRVYSEFIINRPHSKERNQEFIKLMTSTEAEMVKYATNTYFASKVSFFNNLYETCVASGISFEVVKEQMLLDDRMGKSHTAVPGPDEQFGFGGTCFAKDINGFLHYASRLGLNLDNFIAATAWKANGHYRETEDWKDRLGATTSFSYENNKKKKL